MYEPPLATFEKYGLMLRLPLPTTKDDLLTHLIDLESGRFELSKQRCDWQRQLYEARAKLHHPKDKDLTDLDRNIMLNGNVAFIQRDYEFLLALEKLAGERLEFGRQLLTML